MNREKIESHKNTFKIRVEKNGHDTQGYSPEWERSHPERYEGMLTALTELEKEGYSVGYTVNFGVRDYLITKN